MGVLARRNARAFRWMAAALGVAAALGLLELCGRVLARRWASPEAFSGRVENWHRNGMDPNCFRPSAELGFEPVPGACGYNLHGVLDRGYPLAKAPDVTRVLALGDSVTRRGLYLQVLERGLAQALPGRRIEVWNAGVEGYNAVQYSAWFERHGQFYDADYCLVMVHQNDFTATSVAYRQNGYVAVFSPGDSLYKTGLYREWWFVHSAGYRMLLMLLERALANRRHLHDEIFADTLAALDRIRARCAQRRCGLLVLVLPFIKPYEEYSPRERANYTGLLAFLDARGVPTLDLTPILLPGGVQRLRGAVGQPLTDGPWDTWHPNALGHELIGAATTERLAVMLPAPRSR